MVQFDFDAGQYEPDAGLAAIPAGTYAAHITNSDKRDNKNGSGWHLWYEFEVREGPYRGRKVFTRFNLGHSNPETVRIANAQHSALCRAVGKMRVTDTTQLHMLPVEIKVTHREATEQYDASNDIRGYRAIGGGAGAVSPAAQAAQQQSPAGASGGEAPWGRK